MISVKSLKLVNEKNVKYDFQKITTPKNIYDVMQKIGATQKAQEYMYILCLDIKNCINCIANVGIGSINTAIADKRTVFQYMYLTNSTKMILVHNHPSGDTTPSVQDIETTNKINEICKILDFQLLDHIIISDGSYTSLKEEGVF